MIEDLIIIIPTHNRQHYLRRVIKYYTEFPCKVYICDSSSEKADVESSGNIVYRWVPQSNFYGKVLDVLNETSAEFYALSPDDDFLKQETLMECYEALNKNNDFYAGLGRQVLFSEHFDGSFWSPDYLNGLSNIGKSSFHSKEEYVKYFESNYQNILWSLFRREVIKKAFECLSECNFSNGNFIEIILGIETLRKGSVYVSKNGLNFREIVSSNHWGSTTLSISRINIRKNAQMSEDFAKFLNYFDDGGFAELCLNCYLGLDEKTYVKADLITRIVAVSSNLFRIFLDNFSPKSVNREKRAFVYVDNAMSALLTKAIF